MNKRVLIEVKGDNEKDCQHEKEGEVCEKCKRLLDSEKQEDKPVVKESKDNKRLLLG